MDYDFKYICPKCGKEVTWSRIELSDGEFLDCLDWTCKNCGAQVIKFEEVGL